MNSPRHIDLRHGPRDSGRIFNATQQIVQASRRRKALEAELEEERARLRDLGHRVKSGFQMLADMLDPKPAAPAKGLTPKARAACAAEQLDLAGHRVRIIAMLQQLIQRDPLAARIGFDEFLLRYCDYLTRKVLAEGPIRLVASVNAARVAGPMALPLGLIVNELVQHAVARAFAAKKPGMITIGLEQVAGAVRLTLRHTGAPVSGCPELVRSLARRIGAIHDMTPCGTGHSITLREA